MIEDLLTREAPAWLLYLVTFFLAFGESAFLVDLVTPGEAGMVLAGAVTRSSGSLPITIGMCAAGALVGDSVGFAVGSRFGWEVVDRFSWTKRRLRPVAERATRAVDRHRGRAVFAGRWVGWLRAVVPLVAGASKMRYAQFLAWDVPAALTWSTVVVSAGYLFGRPAARVIDRFGWVIFVVAAALVGSWFVISRRRGR